MSSPNKKQILTAASILALIRFNFATTFVRAASAYCFLQN